MYGLFKSSWFGYYKDAIIATLMVLLGRWLKFRCNVLPAKGSMESFPDDCLPKCNISRTCVYFYRCYNSVMVSTLRPFHCNFKSL